MVAAIWYLGLVWHEVSVGLQRAALGDSFSGMNMHSSEWETQIKRCGVEQGRCAAGVVPPSRLQELETSEIHGILRDCGAVFRTCGELRL